VADTGTQDGWFCDPSNPYYSTDGEHIV